MIITCEDQGSPFNFVLIYLSFCFKFCYINTTIEPAKSNIPNSKGNSIYVIYDRTCRGVQQLPFLQSFVSANRFNSSLSDAGREGIRVKGAPKSRQTCLHSLRFTYRCFVGYVYIRILLRGMQIIQVLKKTLIKVLSC